MKENQQPPEHALTTGEKTTLYVAAAAALALMLYALAVSIAIATGWM